MRGTRWDEACSAVCCSDPNCKSEPRGESWKLTPPHSWALSLFWVAGGALEAFSTQNCMLLWMEATGRFGRDANVTYPLGVTAVGIVATLVTALAIDASGRHMPWGFLACGLQAVACVLLLVRRLPDGAIFAAYCEFLVVARSVRLHGEHASARAVAVG